MRSVAFGCDSRQRLFFALSAMIGTLSLGESVALATVGEDVGIALHLGTPAPKSACAAASEGGCGDVVLEGSLYPSKYYAYVLLVNDSQASVRGTAFGVQYNAEAETGVDVFQWSSCLGVQIPDSDWPSAGAGLRLAWSEDLEGPNPLILGYFYCTAYSSDQMSIVGFPSKDGVGLFDTAGRVTWSSTESTPARFGSVHFGEGGYGVNPCVEQQGGVSVTSLSRELAPIKLIPPVSVEILGTRTPRVRTAIAKPGIVEIQIFDVGGRLLDSRSQVLTQELEWTVPLKSFRPRGSALPQGLLFVRAKADGAVAVAKYVYLRGGTGE